MFYVRRIYGGFNKMQRHLVLGIRSGALKKIKIKHLVRIASFTAHTQLSLNLAVLYACCVNTHHIVRARVEKYQYILDCELLFRVNYTQGNAPR